MVYAPFGTRLASQTPLKENFIQGILGMVALFVNYEETNFFRRDYF